MKPTFTLCGGNRIDKAIFLATQAHMGQLDKAGNPYILHPLRVMLTQKDRELQIAAVLHDVVEDTEVTLEDIVREFDPNIANMVDILTRKKNQSRRNYIKNITHHPVLLSVKLQDMKDNLSPNRMYHLASEVRERLLAKYKKDLLYMKSLGCKNELLDELLHRFEKGA
ncbi:HD domain protein [uncultured archaeon]|nr:HD domain protein [uncultured archaeon]